MTETTPATSAELGAQAQAETHRATELARRRSEIDVEIRELREEIRQERLRLARTGASIETPMLTDQLNALLAEREDLPEQHYVAREQAASLMIRAESTRMQELQPEIQAAQADHEQAQDALKEAERVADEKEATMGSLRQTRYIAQERRKHHEALLDQISKEGVRPMAPLD